MRRKDGQSSAQHALEDIDRETVFHPNTSIVDHLKKGPHIVAQASGVRVKDRQGRDLIDAGAGLWCVNIGYGGEEMADAAKKAIEMLAQPAGWVQSTSGHSSWVN